MSTDFERRVRKGGANIAKGDFVLHNLSGLYFRCENHQHARWMNQNKYYKLIDPIDAPPTYYFDKNKH